MSIDDQFANLSLGDEPALLEAVKSKGVIASGLAANIHALAGKAESKDDAEAIAISGRQPEHHRRRIVAQAAGPREQFRVARYVVASGMERLLMKRPGDDGRHLARPGRREGRLDGPGRGATTGRGNLGKPDRRSRCRIA